MALMKCDKSTERTLLTRRGPKIGLVINHVVPHWIKWLWRLKSFGCPVRSPALLRRDAPGKEEGGEQRQGRKRRSQTEREGQSEKLDWMKGEAARWWWVRVRGWSPGCPTPPCLEAPLCSEMRKAPCTWASRAGASGGRGAWAGLSPRRSVLLQLAPDIYLTLRQEQQSKSNPQPINYRSHSSFSPPYIPPPPTTSPQPLPLFFPCYPRVSPFSLPSAGLPLQDKLGCQRAGCNVANLPLQRTAWQMLRGGRTVWSTFYTSVLLPRRGERVMQGDEKGARNERKGGWDKIERVTFRGIMSLWTMAEMLPSTCPSAAG